MNFLYETGYKKIIIIGLVILVALVVGIFIYMNNQEVEEPVVEAPPTNIVLDYEPIVIEPEVVEQKNSVSKVIAYVTAVRDIGNYVDYDLEVGLGENTTSSTVRASGGTVFYSMDEKRMLLPSEVKVGNSVIVHALGSYKIGNLNAKAICVGTDTGYTFAKVLAINSNPDGSYTWKIEGMDNLLVVDSNCVLYDAYAETTFKNMGKMQIGHKILYKGDVITEPNSEYVKCTEVVTLGAHE